MNYHPLLLPNEELFPEERLHILEHAIWNEFIKQLCASMDYKLHGLAQVWVTGYQIVHVGIDRLHPTIIIIHSNDRLYIRYKYSMYEEYSTWYDYGLLISDPNRKNNH